MLQESPRRGDRDAVKLATAAATALLVGSTAACAPKTPSGGKTSDDAAVKATPVNTNEPGERPLGGWGPLQDRMKAMTKDAEAIIDRARATSGDAETRFALAQMEIHFAMRDEFGPANAALFNARDKKIQELAGAVGKTKPPEAIPHRIDDFVRETRSFAEQIRAAGFTVVEAPVMARKLLWMPGETVGWEMVISDPKRTVDEDVPYSGTPHGAPKPATPAKVHPSIRLYAFPQVRMTASQSMVKREQPGEVVAAGIGAVLFRLQAAQSRDQDPDGTIGKAVDAALWREPRKKETPALAKAMGGGTAIVEKGVARVSGRGPAPESVPSTPGVEEPEMRIVLWYVQQGPDIDYTLIPTNK